MRHTLQRAYTFATDALRWLLQSRGVRSVLGVTAAALILWLAWRYRSGLHALILNASPLLLLLSIALGILANYLTGLPFRLFLAQHGISIRFRRAGWLQLAAQVTKYIPGKVWSAVLQAQLIGTHRIGGTLLAGMDASIFLMLTLSGLGVALLLVHLTFFGAILWLVTWFAGVALISSKALLARLANTLSATRAGEASTLEPAAGPRSSVMSFAAGGLLHAVVHTASIVTLLMATTDFDAQSLSVAAASVLLAWVIGNLAVVVPTGLGVREVTFIGLSQALALPAEIETLAAVSILIRLAQLVQDVITAGVVVPAIVRPRALE
ncbi:lysylphosphatidylglycerol synthase domain-containing protein [Sinimarinibacterium flocculans]|uniref:lysylphosphatidylglycerol synthase domain-containing protein n=1 Tax=Sinimarinibacterium flocculans TaxID=985250 RepID=UPI003511C13C